MASEKRPVTETPGQGFCICTGLGRGYSELEESVNDLNLRGLNKTTICQCGNFPLSSKGNILGQYTIKIYFQIYKAGPKSWPNTFSFEREVSISGQVQPNMRVSTE